jgi:hypothetical protein
MIAPSRRTTLQWVVAAAASPLLAGCADATGWRDVRLTKSNGPGYGTDPDLMVPEAPWPLTLTAEQREIIRDAADLIIPADEHSPSAGALGVDVFIDEWVSAPYERQQGDRELIVSGLTWLERESRKRFDTGFAAATAAQQGEILNDIAFNERIKEGHDKQAEFFRRLRGLVMAGFYTMPEGIADIGYMGNAPMQGAYPGPTTEALNHLRGKLTELGLAMPPLSGTTTRG